VTPAEPIHQVPEAAVSPADKTTRADPERSSVVGALCEQCARLPADGVDELIMLRRRWFVAAWRYGLRPLD